VTDERTTRAGLGRLIAPLGRRLVARGKRISRAAGVRLADEVTARRQPKRLEDATRLAAGRTLPARVGRVVAAAAPPAPRPAGMTDWAARWLFGDGPVEGVPFAGGAALRDRELAQPEQPAAPSPAPRRLARTPARGRIEEGSRMRLSATPPPKAAAKPPDHAPAPPIRPASDVSSAAPASPFERTAAAPSREDSAQAGRPEPLKQPADDRPHAVRAPAVATPVTMRPRSVASAGRERPLLRVHGVAQATPAAAAPVQRPAGRGMLRRLVDVARRRRSATQSPLDGAQPAAASAVERRTDSARPTASADREPGVSSGAAAAPVGDRVPAAPSRPHDDEARGAAEHGAIGSAGRVGDEEPTPRSAAVAEPVRARPPKVAGPLPAAPPPAVPAIGRASRVLARLRGGSAERSERTAAPAKAPAAEAGGTGAAAASPPAEPVVPIAASPIAQSSSAESPSAESRRDGGPSHDAARAPESASAPAPAAPGERTPSSTPPDMAVAPAPLLRSSERAPARPVVQLRRRTSEQSGPVGPAPLRTVAPTAGSGPERLASAIGSALSAAPDGLTTIEFPGAPGSTASAPLARQPAGETEAAHPSVPAPPPVTPPQQAGGGVARDVEEIYEHVVQRLRREILLEREAMGDLTGDVT
jgi:hypothetical protein